MNILAKWGAATRNRLHLRATKLDSIVLGVLVAITIALPAHIPVAGWQILASYTVIFMLSVILWRRSWEKRNEKTAT